MEWDGAAGLSVLKDTHQNALIEVNALAGDVVIFHESTTHAVAPWRGEQPRCTLLYAFVPGFMALQGTELELPAWVSGVSFLKRLLSCSCFDISVEYLFCVSELTPGQASRFESPWRSSTKGGGLMARHAANLIKWQAKAKAAKL